MANDCRRHRRSNAITDPEVSRLLEMLPENQSGAGRHRCAYCAYEQGVEHGRARERHRIAKFLGLIADDMGSSNT